MARSAGALQAALQHLAALGIVHAAPAGDFGGRALTADADVLLIQRADMHAGRAHGFLVIHRQRPALGHSAGHYERNGRHWPPASSSAVR